MAGRVVAPPRRAADAARAARAPRARRPRGDRRPRRHPARRPLAAPRAGRDRGAVRRSATGPRLTGLGIVARLPRRAARPVVLRAPAHRPAAVAQRAPRDARSSTSSASSTRSAPGTDAGTVWLRALLARHRRADRWPASCAACTRAGPPRAARPRAEAAGVSAGAASSPAAGSRRSAAARRCAPPGDDGPIRIVGDEPHRPYDRPPLSKELLGGRGRRRRRCGRADWYAEHGVELRLGAPPRRPRSRRPARDARRRRASSPTTHLLIATGGAPRRSPGLRGHAERPRAAHARRRAARSRAALAPGVRLADRRRRPHRPRGRGHGAPRSASR